MPDLNFDEMKKLYPGASDDEVIQKIQSIDQPDYVSGSDPMFSSPETPIVPASDPYKDMAIQNVKEKYGLNDKYSDDQRQKLVDEIKQSAEGPNWKAGLSALGAGISGGNASAAADSVIKNQAAERENKLNQFDLARTQAVKSRDDLLAQDKLKKEMDPNSIESKMAQDLAVQMGMDPEQAKGLTAAKFKEFSPIMEKKYQIAETAQARRDAADTAAQSRKDTAQIAADARRDAAQLRKEEMANKKAEDLTIGQKSVDRDFAKDYNEWTSGGQAATDKNLDRLKEARDVLAQHKDDLFGTSGRFTGRLPDALRSQESIRLRQDVQAAAQGALKATLGSQFTEKEGERIMAAAYDEKLSPDENLRKIDAAIKELETSKQNKNAKTKFFEQSGGLKGFSVAPDSAIAPSASAPMTSKKPSWAK